MSEENKPAEAKEDWMQKKWRPAMGWTYMIICMLDMAIFPVLWSIAQMVTKQPITQWNPLTLQGAGLFHLAMGAVLGISAFGRTQEKVAGASVVSTATPVPPAPAAPAVSAAPPMPPRPMPPRPPVAAPAVAADEPPLNPRHRDD